MLRIEGSAEHSHCTCMYVEIDLHALLMENFELRVLRIEPINTAAVQRCARESTEFASR